MNPDPSMEAAKSILITGASGFIGSFLSEYFATRNWIVFGIDRNPPADTRFFQQYFQMEVPPRGQYAALARINPDVIVHTAGSANVSASVTEPYADFTSSVPGTAFLLEWLRDMHPGGCFVYLSSAAVYGNPRDQPIRESAGVNPLSPYGFHKHLNEIICREYQEVFNIRTIILRIFSAYGETLRKQVLWDVCNKLSLGDHILLHGTGTETRDFIHVSDLAQAIELLLEVSPPPDQDPETYNIANGSSIAISEVAGILRDIVNPAADVQFNQENLAGYPTRWTADISRIRSRGFKPQITAREGIASYGQWFKSLAPGNSCKQ